MPADDSESYNLAMRGSLKIKNRGDTYRKLTDIEAKEKKKKKKLKKVKKKEKKLKKHAEKILEDSVRIRKELESEKSLAKEKDPLTFLTESQRRIQKQLEEKELKDIEKYVQTSHKDRIKVMNDKLLNLSEIHDIPKVSWTK